MYPVLDIPQISTDGFRIIEISTVNIRCKPEFAFQNGKKLHEKPLFAICGRKYEQHASVSVINMFLHMQLIPSFDLFILGNDESHAVLTANAISYLFLQEVNRVWKEL